MKITTKIEGLNILCYALILHLIAFNYVTISFMIHQVSEIKNITFSGMCKVKASN